jgi:UDP-glucose 4-epimerase
MKILITGGAGFIGSHLAFSLEGLGNEITVLDNMTTGSSSNLQGFEGKLVPGDIRNSLLVEELVMDNDCIIHMAASLGVQRIMESTLESMSVNILGSEVVLLASAKYGKRTLIASTSEIYGKNPKQPLSETDDRVIGSPQKIRWSYSDAKAIEEAMAQALFIEENLPVTTVRFFNTVGPKQTGRYGMVIPKLVSSAVKNETLKVHGDGSQSRVFCHVLDAVDAITKLIVTDKSIGEVYNIGGKEEITIENLAKRIISKSNSKSIIEYVPHSGVYPIGFEDIHRRVPDIGKIERDFGWHPKLSLDEILDDVINEFKFDPTKS